MKIIKRDGHIVDYMPEKIENAIKKANLEVDEEERVTDIQIKNIIKYIENLKKKRILVEDIQDIIEMRLMSLGKYALAKQYITYRYTRELVRRSNTTDLSIKELINGENEFIPKNEELVKVPLLGKITAGKPIEAIENPDEFFTIPANLIPRKETVFTLKVSGESMINAGILDGDIVIIQKQKIAHNGDIVVAMTEENEVTLKRFYKEKDYIRLQPENDNMKPIILSNCTIIGKAIGLYRKI